MKTFFQELADHFAFVAVAVLIAAGIVLLSALIQKYFCKDMPKRRGPRYLAYTALFSALAAVLMMLEIPLFFAPGFYKLDFSEVPVLICAFYLGPVAGVLSEFLKLLLFLCLHGTTSAFVGEFANFVIGCTMMLPASALYHRHRSKKTALSGMIVGTFVMTAAGSLFNAWYLLPKFAELYGMPLDAIVAMGTAVNGAITDVGTLVLFAVVPFNLLKGVLLTVITFFLYKRLSPLLSRGSFSG